MTEEPEIGAIGMSPGQVCRQWDGERWVRRPDLDGLTLVDAMHAAQYLIVETATNKT